MRPRDDDQDVDPSRDLDDRSADALLSGRAVEHETALGAFVSELRGLGGASAPLPNQALAAMLDAGLTPGSPLPARPRSTAGMRLRAAVSWRTATDQAVSWRTAPARRSWALPLQLSLAGSGCLALVLVAAAANELPDAAQTAVADVVEAITPLELPRPSGDDQQPAVSPLPTPTTTPSSDDPTPAAADSDDQRGHGDGQASPGADDVREDDDRDDGRSPDPRASDSPDRDDDSDDRDEDPRDDPQPRETSDDERSGSDSDSPETSGSRQPSGSEGSGGSADQPSDD